MFKRIATLLSLGLLASAVGARADSIVFDGALDITGFGFGSNPRALTIQSHGPGTNSEQGCVAPGASGLISGSSACAPADGLVGGDEAPPINFPKQAAPTLSSLGIVSADEIGILFDGVQPQNANNATVTITDLTFKLYNGTTLVYSVSQSFSPLATNPGNGTSDYLFSLDAAAQASVNALLLSNIDYSMALDSSISFPNQSAGPDSYTIIRSTPEPSSLLLPGSGILGAAGLFYRRLSRTDDKPE